MKCSKWPVTCGLLVCSSSAPECAQGVICSSRNFPNNHALACLLEKASWDVEIVTAEGVVKVLLSDSPWKLFDRDRKTWMQKLFLLFLFPRLFCISLFQESGLSLNISVSVSISTALLSWEDAFSRLFGSAHFSLHQWKCSFHPYSACPKLDWFLEFLYLLMGCLYLVPQFFTVAFLKVFCFLLSTFELWD